MALVLCACDDQNQAVPTTSSLGNSVVSGMAAGVGMAAGHHAVNGAVNKWQSRRAPRTPRTYRTMPRHR